MTAASGPPLIVFKKGPSSMKNYVRGFCGLLLLPLYLNGAHEEAPTPADATPKVITNTLGMRLVRLPIGFRVVCEVRG